jgi:hypothetical protein
MGSMISSDGRKILTHSATGGNSDGSSSVIFVPFVAKDG